MKRVNREVWAELCGYLAFLGGPIVAGWLLWANVGLWATGVLIGLLLSPCGFAMLSRERDFGETTEGTSGTASGTSGTASGTSGTPQERVERVLRDPHAFLPGARRD